MASRRAQIVFALYAALMAAAILPLLAVTVPPLVDYPNHLARAHVLSAIDETPVLQDSYTAQRHISTNMPMSILVPAMAKVMDIYDAGRVFIAMSILLVVAGLIALRKAVNKEIGVWPAVAFLFLYNHILFWGFLNYYFGAGLFLLGFAAWIGLRERQTWLRFGVFVVVSAILYFCHIFALGMYALSVFGYEIWRFREAPATDRASLIRSWAVTFGQFAPISLLFIGWTNNFVSAPGKHETLWRASSKVISVFSPTLFNGNIIDIVTLFAVLAALYWCLRSRHVSFAPALRWPLALLTVAALLMPTELLGVWGTDFRIPPFLAMLLVAGFRFERDIRRHVRVVVGIAVALFAWRVGDVSYEWHARDIQVRELRTALQNVRQGARVLFVQDPQDTPLELPLYGQQSYWHIGSLSVIDRAAFLPSLFTGHTQLSAAPATAKIDTPVTSPLTRRMLKNSTGDTHGNRRLGDQVNRFLKAFWVGWPKHFDYVIVVRYDNSANPAPKFLRPVATGSFFDIYRIVPERKQANR